VRLGKSGPARIGLIVDALGDREMERILDSANALRAVRGLPIVGCVCTSSKVEVSVRRSKHGHFLGQVDNAEVLFEAADALVDRGANALAVVTAIGGVSEGDLALHYREGGLNPVGSAEALISRALTARTGLPAAHAPAFVAGLGECRGAIDPRAAAEVASGSGLPCVLEGLTHAPRAVGSGGLGVGDLSAIVVPASCAGGAPAVAARRAGVPLVAVLENRCAVGVGAERIHGLEPIVVATYAEAIGFVACQRAGVTWEAIRRPLQPIVPRGLR